MGIRSCNECNGVSLVYVACSVFDIWEGQEWVMYSLVLGNFHCKLLSFLCRIIDYDVLSTECNGASF